MGSGTERIYNIISIVFLGLTALVFLIVGINLITPPPPIPEADLPTLLILPSPTITPSLTATHTSLPSTFTPTFTPTLTVTATLTATVTISPSPTITNTPPATETPAISDTPTLTPTLTITPGPSPTNVPTTSPFPFAVQQPIDFTANFANSAGCAWQGVGGQVLGLDGQPFSGQLQIHVFNGLVDRVIRAGTNTLYGVSGYEAQVSENITGDIFFIQLESVNGVAVSEQTQIRFPADCSGNLALVNFAQLR